MAGITLATADARLTLYLDAEAKILAGQKVSLAGKDLTRADLDSVQKGIDIWQQRVTQLSRPGGGIRAVRVVPRP